MFRLNFFGATLQIFNRENSIVALVNIFNGFSGVLLHVMYEITLNWICLRRMYTFVNILRICFEENTTVLFRQLQQIVIAKYFPIWFKFSVFS